MPDAVKLFDHEHPANPLGVSGSPLIVQTSGGDINDPSIVSSPVHTYTQVTGTVSTINDNTLIAAPGAGNRLVIIDLLVQNESTVETTVILKSGSTAKWRAKLSANASLSLSFTVGEEWRLGTNEALVLNLSAANSSGYSVRYRVEAV